MYEYYFLINLVMNYLGVACIECLIIAVSESFIQFMRVLHIPLCYF